MLESYYEEIARKKRAARIFWLIVFIFAGFLFFFFQGYYPDIRLWLTSIGSGTISGENQRVSIRSFWIINIKVSPENLDLRLNTLPYGNNEKKIVDYGDYAFTVSGEGYLPWNFTFSIDNEKPYYIDLLTIIEKPRYSRFATPVDQVARISEDVWIIGNNSGMTLYEWGFLTGTVISKKQFSHIGEWYFLSGGKIVSYNIEEKSWDTLNNEWWEWFAEDCKNPVVTENIMSCKEKREMILQNGKTYSGITEIGKWYFRTQESLFSLEESRVRKITSGSGKSLPVTGSKIISINNSWYYSQSGSLVPIAGDGKKIVSTLSVINHAEWSEGELLIFWRKWKDTYLALYDINFPEKIRIIPFPDIELDSMRIWKDKRNTFIKTNNTLLCIYHGSKETHWIIDGKILTAGTTTALYEKDGKIWRADWKSLLP